jgi:hypothetical protein
MPRNNACDVISRNVLRFPFLPRSTGSCRPTPAVRHHIFDGPPFGHSERLDRRQKVDRHRDMDARFRKRGNRSGHRADTRRPVLDRLQGVARKFLLRVELRALSSIDGRDVTRVAFIWAAQSAASEYRTEVLCSANRVAAEPPHSLMALRQERRLRPELLVRLPFLPEPNHDGFARYKMLRSH